LVRETEHVGLEDLDAVRLEEHRVHAETTKPRLRRRDARDAQSSSAGKQHVFQDWFLLALAEMSKRSGPVPVERVALPQPTFQLLRCACEKLCS